jgi:predicted negative regulator of RcsB-dependent stress response
MDEEITIINNNSRNEKIKKFIISNKRKIISLAVTIIFLLCAYFLYEEIVKRNKIKISNSYNLSVSTFQSGDQNKAKKKLVNIINKKDSTYSPLALYFLIDNKIITETKEINSLFDKIINETRLEGEIKNLLIFKKALFNSDFENENELINMLNPIINSESIWKSHSLFLLGEYFLSKNEKQKAKEFFNQILILENSNQEIKLETQKKLNRDFSE